MEDPGFLVAAGSIALAVFVESSLRVVDAEVIVAEFIGEVYVDV
jgi:hypothetical protein